MPEPAPNAELLRSLGRLVRGLSALFWGLPAALVVCVGTASAGWFGDYGIAPPVAATGLLFFGLWQLGSFQKQERPWRNALDRARLFALVNLWLSPFLYWWNRLPGQPFFGVVLEILAVSALLFLIFLNLALKRLGAMLPDEALRHEIRQFTLLNSGLLLTTLAAVLVWVATRQFDLPWRLLPGALVWFTQDASTVFRLGYLLPAAVFLLLPLAMTMALIWKTKEVILDSVFGMKR
jgi:hypothetical protein